MKKQTVFTACLRFCLISGSGLKRSWKHEVRANPKLLDFYISTVRVPILSRGTSGSYVLKIYNKIEMLATVGSPVIRNVCGTVQNRGGVASTSKMNTFHPASRTATPRPDFHYSHHRAMSSTRLSATGSATGKIEINKAPPTPITLTEGAVSHLKKLKSERGEPKAVLRVGVKSGGCSGMSYVMDFIEKAEDMKPDDTVLSYEDGEIEIRVDPKSLLYLFGLQLDHSSELIGGGYKVRKNKLNNSLENNQLVNARSRKSGTNMMYNVFLCSSQTLMHHHLAAAAPLSLYKLLKINK